MKRAHTARRLSARVLRVPRVLRVLVSAGIVLGAISCANESLPRRVLIKPPKVERPRDGTKPWSRDDGRGLVKVWNEVALAVIKDRGLRAKEASRLLAIMHVSMFDAASGASDLSQYESFTGIAGIKDGDGKTPSPRVAAAAAAYHVLQAYEPQSLADEIEFLFAEELSFETSEEAKKAGGELGRGVAYAILKNRGLEDASTPPGLSPSVQPGTWTPPSGGSYELSGWGRLTPWALSFSSQFRPKGPPSLGSDVYLSALKGVHQAGSAGSLVRSLDETEAVFFWDEASAGVSIPGRWNTILNSVIPRCRNSLLERLRLYALLNVAIADAAIATGDAKWAFFRWSPGGAIVQSGGELGIAVEASPPWEPLIKDDLSPSYVDEYAAMSGAAAKVLEIFFADEEPSHFFVAPLGTGQKKRFYTSFAGVAGEIARSRVGGGVQFSFDGEDGLLLGQKVGALAAKKLFKSESDEASTGEKCLSNW